MPSFRRRLLMNVEKKYTPVEYLESTGTQYIDTLFKVNQDTRVVVDSEITDYFKTGYYQAIFGATTVSGYAETNRYTLHLSSSYKDIYIAYGNAGYRSNFGDVNKRNIYDLDKNTFKVNGSTIASTTQETFQGTETLNIFREKNSNNQNNRYINMKLYSTKIYDNGVLIRDFVPVIDSSDRPCLYDKVEDKFYYNEGSGEFLYE